MNIQKLRERAGLSRAEVAFKLDVSESTISNWETGRHETTMTPKKYLELTKLFKCTPEELAAASEQSLSQKQKRKPGRPKRTDESS